MLAMECQNPDFLFSGDESQEINIVKYDTRIRE
jgi:hypothetical protein